jgi:hypothetical protein
MRQIFKLVNITTTIYIPVLEAASWLVQPKKLKGTEVIFSTSFLAVNCMNYEKKNPHFVPFFGLTSQKETRK